MQPLRRLFSSPAFHLCLIAAVMLFAFLRTHIVPQDNHFDFERFIETLAAGKLDMSIPGFQGASFLALPIYLLTGSHLTNVWFQLLCALCIPAVGYWAAKGLFKDTVQALLFAYALALMPFLEFVAFRGFSFPAYTLLLLLTIGLRVRGSAWAWLPLAFSIITKPFSVALLPLFILWEPRAGKKGRMHRGWVQYALAAIIPAAYVIVEWSQLGHLMIGAHTDIDQSNVFVLQRLPLNVLHGIQMMFSIHNYYFPNPAQTGDGNLTHSSPLLILLGCLSFLYPKNWKDKRLARVLGLSALLAFLLAASLDHMDHFYSETAVILLTLAAIPVLTEYLLLLPLLLVTLHFQFFYMYLWWRGVYFSDLSIFAIPIIVDVVAILCWLLFIAPTVHWKKIGEWFRHVS